MASLTDRILKGLGLQRFQPYTPEEIAAMWGSIGVGYSPTYTTNNKQEPIGQGFASLVTQAYAQNPVVFACEQARVQLFSEARFTFQRMEKGRPGEFTNQPSTYLRLLEEPWPGGTTSMLLKDALLDADLAGNGFILREPNGLRRLRPDWVTIIAGSPNRDASTWDLEVEILGYGYQPGGPQSGNKPILIDRRYVAHFKSTHDPLRRFSGLPWLLPVVRDISADQAATSHKLKYFENAATPNIAIRYPETMLEAQVRKWAEMFRKDHEGALNAYKTVFLGGGADLTVVGANLRQADFSGAQSGGELRIASAAGVPPIIIGIKGGLDSATYSNYGQARRAFADLTMRPLWRDISGALENITQVPTGARLWYDDRDISFLQEDVKDAAEIFSLQASAMRQLVDAGFDPASVVDAAVSLDNNRLSHTGLYSVQLQPPQPKTPPQVPPGPASPPQLGAGQANRAEAGDIRCTDCGKLLAKRTAPGGSFEIKCRGCNALVAA